MLLGYPRYGTNTWFVLKARFDRSIPKITIDLFHLSLNAISVRLIALVLVAAFSIFLQNGLTTNWILFKFWLLFINFIDLDFRLDRCFRLRGSFSKLNLFILHQIAEGGIGLQLFFHDSGFISTLLPFIDLDKQILVVSTQFNSLYPLSLVVDSLYIWGFLLFNLSKQVHVQLFISKCFLCLLIKLFKGYFLKVQNLCLKLVVEKNDFKFHIINLL